MAEKVTLVSDLSGKEIEDRKDAACLFVEFPDKRRGQYKLDVTVEEANEYAAKGAKVVAD